MTIHIHIDRVLTEYTVKEGEQLIGMIEQTLKNGYLQWVFMPMQSKPTTIIQLTQFDIQLIDEKITELNKRDHLPEKVKS
ncbi:hypothetical protein [Sulfuricurvum sp.]|uniref:hypothetical protein n=1 Tax=Sulfuricurvum sp. TaxID=2025608 RepID=UPI003564D695